MRRFLVNLYVGPRAFRRIPDSLAVHETLNICVLNDQEAAICSVSQYDRHTIPLQCVQPIILLPSLMRPSDITLICNHQPHPALNYTC